MPREHEGHVMLCSRCGRPTEGDETSPGAISSVCLPGTGCRPEEPTTAEEEPATKKRPGRAS